MANALPPRLPSAPRVAEPDMAAPSQRELAFKNFGVMDTGRQDGRSLPTAMVIFGSVLTAALLVHTTVQKKLAEQKVITFNAVKPLPPEPPKPQVKLPKPPPMKVPPPKPPVDPPVVKVVEPPKIPPPPVEKPDIKPVNQPVVAKKVDPPPAPKPVAISIAQAASVPNNSSHPSPVRLGNLTNPINNTSGPAVAKIDLGHSGAPGMPGSNTGLGNPTKIAIAGSGSPYGTNMSGRDNAARPISGLNNGVPGGTGTGVARPGAIQIASTNPPPAAIRPTVQPTSGAKTGPKVLFKPRPEYTDDAKNNHVEGTVYVKIHVTSSGSVQVMGVSSGLGHGLDQQALRVAAGMRFQPAMSDGRPVDWDGVVNISFQLAS